MLSRKQKRTTLTWFWVQTALLLIDQRDQLLERMEQMQQSLDRLNQKIQNYEQVMAAAETKLKRAEEA